MCQLVSSLVHAIENQTHDCLQKNAGKNVQFSKTQIVLISEVYSKEIRD